METDFPFRYRRLRDLAWAIGSAPLLQATGSETRWLQRDWFRRRYQDYLPVLERLDRDAAGLVSLSGITGSQRLGSYFEQLWLYWLNTNGRFRLLQANLPVRTTGRTLGEFDLLVEDSHSGRQLHWELALKFYLGTGETQHMDNWWGPMKRDRLDLKFSHMQRHQCRLSRLPEARQALQDHGIVVSEVWSIVKGRLFYPRGTVNPQLPEQVALGHLAGWWQTQSGFVATGTEDRSTRYSLLEKKHWLAPLMTGELPLFNDELPPAMLENLAAGRPVMLAVFTGNTETARGFVVPDDWALAGNG